jgi:hypothetical protein
VQPDTLIQHRAALQRFADAFDLLLTTLEPVDPAADPSPLSWRPGCQRETGLRGNDVYRAAYAAARALQVADSAPGSGAEPTGPPLDIRTWYRIFGPPPVIAAEEVRGRCQRGLGRLDDLLAVAIAARPRGWRRVLHGTGRLVAAVFVTAAGAFVTHLAGWTR